MHKREKQFYLSWYRTDQEGHADRVLALKKLGNELVYANLDQIQLHRIVLH